jgi:hypothetical protein
VTQRGGSGSKCEGGGAASDQMSDVVEVEVHPDSPSSSLTDGESSVGESSAIGEKRFGTGQCPDFVVS